MRAFVDASPPVARARRRARRRGGGFRAVLWAVAAALVVAIAVGLLFAGPSGRLAPGTRVAGVAVGGLSPRAATKLLAARQAELAGVPVAFTAGGRMFRITAREVGVGRDWSAAVDEAERNGGGFGVFRGYRRLDLKLFPQDVAPRTYAYGAAVDYELRRIAAAVDRPERSASLLRTGLHVSVAPGSTGLALDTAAARAVVIEALASFSRSPVVLPLERRPPPTTVADLLPVQRVATQVVSAPVSLTLGGRTWTVPRWRLASLLQLPTGSSTRLTLSGAAADAYFSGLRRRVNQPARNATWAPEAGGKVRVVPAVAGRELDLETSAARLLAAAERTQDRTAALAFDVVVPARSTAEAQAMRIGGTVGSYETIYGGDPNRIHNVQLVARLIDGKLIAPGATFSFNQATGARSAAKGFLTAPVIIDGELSTGLGGGVCQVSTTVFNAAYVAGLPITARTNHALYISHYPLGRDATVDYPDVDLRFVNDTGHWLLLRTFVGPDELSVVLYGTPTHRRVVTIASPLKVVSPAPVKKTIDATLKPGQVVVDDPGAPATSTWVERKVYAAGGELLSDQTWYSSYRSQPKLERVGPKKKKKLMPPTGRRPAMPGPGSVGT